MTAADSALRGALRALASPRSSPGVAWLLAGLLLLGAAVRALRFFAPFHWAFHWDETQVAVPALRILGGSLPANVVGPEYFGATPAYVLATWFAVAGSSTWVMNLFAYAIGLLILWTGWLVLRRFLDRPAAILGLAVLAVPPLFLAQWSVTAIPSHPAALALGNVCLLATHTIFVADPGRRRGLLGLGLLAGLGWWLDPLIVIFLAPFAILALRTGLAWRPRAGSFLVGLFIGGLPQWLYEVWYFPSTKFALHQAGGVEAAPFHERLTAVVRDFLPRLAGMDLEAGRPWVVAFLLVGAPLWLGAVAWAAYRDRLELAWLFGRGGGIGRGHVILWITAVTNLALVLATQRTIDHYYLLPLYSVLPCWMGEFLDGLRRRRPLLAGAALAGLLILAGWSNWRDSLGTTAPSERRWAILEPRVDPLIPWLRAHGFDRVYLGESTPFLISYGATYLSGGHVIFADPWRESTVSFGQAVDATVNPPFVATGPPAADLRASLSVIGMSVKDTQVGQLHVLELTPQFTTTFVPLSRSRWTITASDNSERAGDLLDGDVATVWDSRRGQEPGQWLAVDLGGTELVTRIDLLAIDWQNIPGSFRIEVSADGRTWTTTVTATQYWGPLFFSEHHPFLKVRRGRVQAIFPPVHTRHVRIVDTASVAQHSWSGRELFVYGPGGPRPPVPRPGEITDALRREGIDFVYANHWLSAWVRVDSHGTIAAQDSNINLNDSSRTEPDPTELLSPRLEAGTGFLLGADTDPGAVKAALEGQPVSVRESMAGPYRLLAVTPTPPPRRLDKRGWQVTASENATLGRRVIDGDRRTQWTSSSPGNPALSVTVDLGQPRQLRGLEIRPGLPGRDLRVTGSLDGMTWAPLDALTWAGSLYWTGSELLRNGGPKWAVLFPRTTLRYLRLSPATTFIEPWTLAEVDAIE
jgi:F5/8 type C domain/Dolichyl-phosphate-mannose-protein mannosyltransferase